MKKILDACCGPKHMWFNKKETHTIYMDIRHEKKGYIKLQPNCSVEPCVIGDYRRMPFDDKSFKLVAWDIPHILGKKISGVIMQKYGYLDKDTYIEDLQKGFSEIMRVLDDYGVLTLKFSDASIPANKLLSIFPINPLYGTKTSKSANITYWFCYMKFPREATA